MNYIPSRFISDDFLFSENEHWFYIHGAPLLQEVGWKLYIPFTNEFAEVVLSKLTPMLKKKELNFKYIKSPSTLQKLNSGECGYSQIGKCVVIYHPDVERTFILELIETLRDVIAAYPRPPYLAKLCENPPIFYRYGDYLNLSQSAKSIWDARTTVERGTLISTSVYEFDHVDKEPVDTLNKLLLQYPVVDVISQQGKGGVFVAVDIYEQEYTEVIIKLGYKHGNEISPGIDGILLIRNEESILNYLTSLKKTFKTPRVIATAYGNESYAIVQEKMNGENARVLLQKGEIGINVVDSIIDGIRCLHQAGVVWCDAKIENIVVGNDDKEISFVDFETSTLSGSLNPHCMRTFQLKEDETLTYSAEDLDFVHFLISMLFVASTDDQRNIDIGWMMRRTYQSPVQSHCAQLLRSYLHDC